AARLQRAVAFVGQHGETGDARQAAGASRRRRSRGQAVLPAAGKQPGRQRGADPGQPGWSRQAWYGNHGVVVFIEHGRVVQTTGLDQNLDGLQLPADDPFARGLQTLTAPVTYRVGKDWSPGYRYGVPVEATLVPAGHEQISILDTTHDVVRVDEQLSAPAMHYRATNHYWVDPRDGFIWKSEQQVAPGLT